MLLPEFLSRDEFGEILLTGHRIPLYTLVRLAKEGRTEKEIAGALPTLTLAEVKRVLEFCAANQAEVDAYVEMVRTEIERQASMPPGPGVLKVRKLQALLAQADHEYAADPHWKSLSVADKLNRLGVLDAATAR